MNLMYKNGYSYYALQPDVLMIICKYFVDKQYIYIESGQKIKSLEEKIKFYETTLKMHPDGQQILDLKDDFLQK